MTLPKPLFPIAGFPMIYHHVAALSKIPGMKEILLIGFFEPKIFESFLNDVKNEYNNINIRYLREYQALGTAGCLFHFRDEILRGNPSKFFVMNADICSSFPLNKMLEFHTAYPGALSTLLSTRVDKKDVHKYGCVVTDPNSPHQVLHFVEKPETFISDLISCGVYLFDSKIFDVIKLVIEEKRLKAVENGQESKEEKVRLEQDIVSYLGTQGQLITFTINPDTDFWNQIKTGSSVIPANRSYLQRFKKHESRRLSVSSPNAKVLEDLLKKQPSTLSQEPQLIQPVIIHPTATIHPGTKIGPNVMIGPNATVCKGTRIKDSIILDSVEISHDSCIINSVVGWGSKIGCWSRVEGSPEDAHHLNATYKGLKIPSATILGKEVNVSDEIVIRNCIVLPHKELKYSYHNEILM
ncbi:Proteasome subunit alpha type-2 [Clydaea vesicula]|uniref:mannose-1-phosphate guanylyltransferase n=1 Tax=Clydaea vesicula TaxID=447962 RepID=A0AAD5UBQ3_9FUNG|nr:Proteasome subunit alpha type-2 [Clydaea vesicula]